MNPHIYKRVREVAYQHKNHFQDVMNHPSLNAWKYTVSQGDVGSMVHLYQSYNTNYENALVLYLHVLYDITYDAKLVFLCMDVFQSAKAEQIQALNQENERLLSNFGKNWDDKEYNIRRRKEIEEQISIWEQKTYNKEKIQMTVIQPMAEDLDSLVQHYTKLQTMKASYSELGIDIPDQMSKNMKKLKRRIDALIEDQKDVKRDSLQAELQLTESRKETRARLLKELDELDNKNG